MQKFDMYFAPDYIEMCDIIAFARHLHPGLGSYSPASLNKALVLAAENGCTSIAFPCISTGIYGYPKEEAAKIAVREVKEFLAVKNAKDAECAEGESGRARSPSAPPMEIIFCCFSAHDAAVYEKLLS